jgi:hypothetical protein
MTNNELSGYEQEFTWAKGFFAGGGEIQPEQGSHSGSCIV